MKPPNLLFILSDQQHWRAWSGGGDAGFETPALLRFSLQSRVFDHAYCTTPQCSPSRSSILTGLYPHRTRVRNNVGAAGGEELTGPTMAPWFQQAGYRTGYCGKWHLGGRAEAKAGWEFFHPTSGKPDDAGTTKAALEFLDEGASDTRPWILFVSYDEPHGIYGFGNYAGDSRMELPLPRSWHETRPQDMPPAARRFMEVDQGTAMKNAPEEAWHRYRACYRDAVGKLEKEIGTLLNAHEKTADAQRTIRVFASDHGDMDGQHGLIWKGPFLYDHLVRVPLMISLPGEATLTGVESGMVSLVDLAPTLADLCGVEIPEALDGRSFAPLVQKAPIERTGCRPYVVVQYYGKQQWVEPIHMIRSPEWKYVRYQNAGEHLYHIAEDPDELHDLAADPVHARILEDLRTTLLEWLREQGEAA